MGAPPFGDMENALRGAPVAFRVVQNALPVAQAIGTDNVRLELVAVFRQRQFPRHVRPVQDKALPQARQFNRRFQCQVGQVAIQKRLRPPVQRAGSA